VKLALHLSWLRYFIFAELPAVLFIIGITFPPAAARPFPDDGGLGNDKFVLGCAVKHGLVFAAIAAIQTNHLIKPS
jgi:hypothetical protein